MATKDSKDTEVNVAVLQEKIKNIEEAVQSLTKDRDSALRWGIVTLGAALIGLGSWVFTLFENAVKLR